MSKLVAIFLVAFCLECTAHEKGVKQYPQEGLGKSYFEYPASLAQENVEYIVDEIQRISDHKIISVRAREDFLYDVTVCSIYDKTVSECREGETYIFGTGEKRFANFSINPSIIQFITPKDKNWIELTPRIYSKKPYDNVPFRYHSAISESEVENIIEKIRTVSKNEILQVSYGRDGIHGIMTCSSGARYKYLCSGGESFEYNSHTKTITNLKNPSKWVQ